VAFIAPVGATCRGSRPSPKVPLSGATGTSAPQAIADLIEQAKARRAEMLVRAQAATSRVGKPGLQSESASSKAYSGQQGITNGSTG
jgi:hypothetical protein